MSNQETEARLSAFMHRMENMPDQYAMAVFELCNYVREMSDEKDEVNAKMEALRHGEDKRANNKQLAQGRNPNR